MKEAVTSTETTIPPHIVWPWQVLRYFRMQLKDMNVRHARERAALTAAIIACEHEIGETCDDR